MPSSPTRYGLHRYCTARYGATPDDAPEPAEASPPVGAADAAILLFQRPLGGVGPGPGPVAPPSPAGSLVQAVGRCLEGDGELVHRLGAALNAGAPQKIFWELGPIKTALPAVVLNVANEARSIDSSSTLTNGTLDVSIYARGGTQCRQIADRVRAVLVAAALADSITWDGATLLDLFDLDASPASPPTPAPTSGREWRCIRSFGFVYEEDR